nr:hypothetical protein Iba_scaffold107568CG0010 [Ipomoea batatas]
MAAGDEFELSDGVETAGVNLDRKRSAVSEPPLAGLRVTLLGLRLRPNVPRHESHFSRLPVDLKRPEIPVAVERVHGGPVVVREEARPGEIIRPGGKVGRYRALHDPQGHRFSGLGPLGHE